MEPFIPTDTDEDATQGDAAYVAGNILMDVLSLICGDDAREEPFPTTPEFSDNLVDLEIADILLVEITKVRQYMILVVETETM